MTFIESRVIDPAHPWAFLPDTVELILSDLAKHTLDPIFEDYGDFVYTPVFTSEAAAEKYEGCTEIAGNFWDHSHAFRVYTDEPELIETLRAAIRRNKATPEYIAVREQRRARDGRPSMSAEEFAARVASL